MNNLLDFFSSAIFSNSISNLFILDKQIININSKIEGNKKNESISVLSVSVDDYDWFSNFLGRFKKSMVPYENNFMFITSNRETFILTNDYQPVKIDDIINVGFSTQKIPNMFFGYSYSFQPYINIRGSGTKEFKIHHKYKDIRACYNFIDEVLSIRGVAIGYGINGTNILEKYKQTKIE